LQWRRAHLVAKYEGKIQPAQRQRAQAQRSPAKSVKTRIGGAVSFEAQALVLAGVPESSLRSGEMQDMSKKILLVDDSKMVLMMEEMILGTKKSYTLIRAQDGQEAVEKAIAESHDLVLMDVVMPKMNGFEACKQLRGDKHTCNIPVILVTTKGQEEDVEAGFEHGCNDYLTKPIHGHELLAMVEAYLGE